MKLRTTFWILSLITSLLMFWTGIEGLLQPSTYLKETENWRVQAMGQDFLNLGLIIPFYLYTASYMHERRWYFPLLWSGATLYFIYTYLIYCFAVHFNHLFVFYCLILGLHFFSLLYMLSTYRLATPVIGIRPKLRRITGLYLIVISLLFGLLWLGEIVPSALDGSVPDSLQRSGLFTNPVHVLDLSFVLPGIMITGFLLLGKKSLGNFLAPVALTFLLLMEITIGGLLFILSQKGLEPYPEIALLMLALAVFTLILLVQHVKRNTVMS